MAIHNRNDPESDPAFQRLAEDVARGVYADDAELFLKDLKALIGDTVRRKTKKALLQDALKRSDLMAQLAERTDIEHGDFETMPRGEHVARLSRQEDN
jgi:hypothetical protein